MSLLPTEKSIVKTQDPRNLILFGLPKVLKVYIKLLKLS